MHDRTGQQRPAMLDAEITAPWAWRRAGIDLDSCRVELDQRAIAELHAVAERLTARDDAIEELRPEGFELTATAQVMAELRDRLERGTGFALLRRLPVELWSERQSKAVAWLLTRCVGQIVMQKNDGTRLYDVRDTGTPMGYAVRRSITNLEQDFHTDGGWLTRAPEMVALACLRQAEAGGISRVASLATAHNQLRERHPELLARLYRPFWWDRQGEHAASEALCSRHPIFAWDGTRLTVRYYDDYVRNGQRMMEAPLAAADDAALQALQAVLAAEDNWIDFRLEAGEIEFVNNHLLAHARSAFRDPPAAGAGRHLLRLWIRRQGDIALESGATATG